MIKKIRKLFILFLVLDLGVLGFLIYRYTQNAVPDRLFTYVGELEEITLPFGFETEETRETLKVKNADSGFSMISDQTGEYNISVKWMGFLPVKSVDVRVIRKMKVAPSGEPIGIYVETRGLLVLDTVEIEGQDGMVYEPGGNILKSGDYILKWDGKGVSTTRGLNEAIQKTGKKKVTVSIRRNGSVLQVAIRPVLTTDRTYKIGTWVREDTQGIGTLTYVTEDGTFGTLGHGITDADTGTLLNLSDGEMYRTEILGITRGKKGEPGELQGYMNMIASNEIGRIKKNTPLGVFGEMEKEQIRKYAGEFMPVGMKQEIKPGKAWIYADLEGAAKKYEIEIESLNINSTDNKSMVISVTDKQLLTLTGGIVQGMSGSPIIQDGKVIGAVTHVLVDDPAKGYGVFIENMLSQ